MLNNKIELKMKYFVGRSVWIEKFLNGQFKSEIWMKKYCAVLFSHESKYLEI